MLKKWLVLLAMVFFIPLSIFAQAFEVGKDYQIIDVKTPEFQNTQFATLNPDSKPGAITVTEFFSFGCPACYRFEPILEKWLQSKPSNVTFNRVPIVFNPSWMIYAKAYYMAEQLGVENKIMPLLFDAVQNQGKDINSESALWPFFEKVGVKHEDFTNTFNFSPGIAAKMLRSNTLMRLYKVYEIPTVIVNGQYRINPGMSNGNAKRMISVMNHLITKSQKYSGKDSDAQQEGINPKIKGNAPGQVTPGFLKNSTPNGGEVAAAHESSKPSQSGIIPAENDENPDQREAAPAQENSDSTADGNAPLQPRAHSNAAPTHDTNSNEKEYAPSSEETMPGQGENGAQYGTAPKQDEASPENSDEAPSSTYETSPKNGKLSPSQEDEYPDADENPDVGPDVGPDTDPGADATPNQETPIPNQDEKSATSQRQIDDHEYQQQSTTSRNNALRGPVENSTPKTSLQ